MAIAGTENLKGPEPLTLQHLEHMERWTPAQMIALDPNNPATLHLLEQLISARPELKKELIAQGVIGANTPLFSERSVAADLGRVAAIWERQDQQAVASDNIYAAQATNNNSGSNVLSSFVDSVSSSVSKALEVTMDFAMGAWENIAATSKNMWQKGADLITKTIPNLIIKTIPDTLRRGANIIINKVKDVMAPAMEAAKSFGRSVVKTGATVIAAVVDTTKNVTTAVVNAISSPVQTATNMYNAGREWLANLGGVKKPLAATLAAATVMSVTPTVLPPAQFQAPTGKPTNILSIQPKNAHRPNVNQLRAQTAIQQEAKQLRHEQKPTTQAQQQSLQTPAGRRGNHFALTLAGSNIPAALPQATEATVTANTTHPVQKAAAPVRVAHPRGMIPS